MAVILIVILTACLFGLFFAAFSYCPEHIVEIDGQKTVARVEGLADLAMNYYTYENPLVRGDIPIKSEFFDDEIFGTE